MNKAEKTKQLIVEKTAPLFNVKGYAGTSLSDITEATGLTKGSIYGNFANKDEVALAAFDYNIKTVQDILTQHIGTYDTVREKLLAYVDVYDNFLKLPFPMGGCPILNTATEADDTHPLLRQKAIDAISFWKNRLIKLINNGMETKEFRANIDPEQTALSIIATIEGGIMITKLTGKINYRKAIMQSVREMINGL